MVKVITYGTYDLLHYGHIKLLERAKALGDYLIVGVTADDFDKKRGKINVRQSLMERIEAVRSLGLADEIIVEEYEGQKIDDIKKYDIDIFTVGSDWCGKFDYLNDYCNVVYLERTEGISSSDIREEEHMIRMGLLGDSLFLNKIINEAQYVDGLKVVAINTNRADEMKTADSDIVLVDDYDELLENVEAVYIRSVPQNHYDDIKKALLANKHVLCESPITVSLEQSKELFALAKSRGLVLMEAIKTAYSTAYNRLLLLLKGGIIGDIISVDATCTSLINQNEVVRTDWNGIYEWGPTALLPVLQIFGDKPVKYNIISKFDANNPERDIFTKIDLLYDNSVASVKVGDGVKSEGELIISGSEGYAYVPAPWWKTDYFEIRYEDITKNKRYFYQLDGEGIRYELVAFVRSVIRSRNESNIASDVTYMISEIMEKYIKGDNIILK